MNNPQEQLPTPTYRIVRTQTPPDLTARAWEQPASWQSAERGEVSWYHAESRSKPEKLEFRALWDDEAVYVRFDVLDDRVLVAHPEPLGSVWRDSCVEFFVTTSDPSKHFNFEVNAGGNIHYSYIRKPRRMPLPQKYEDWTMGTEAWIPAMDIHHQLPERIEPEQPGPIPWCVAYRVPFALLEAFEPATKRPQPGTEWTGNFHICGDGLSKPRWGAWSPLGERLEFHNPSRFGRIVFA